MEDVLPTVSDLAFRIQEEYNKLEETFVTEDEDDMAERSFIVGELMRLAVNMDYTDQFGRTTMFQHARKFPLPLFIGADICRGDDLAAESTGSIN